MKPNRTDEAFAQVRGSPGAAPRLAGLGRMVGPALLACAAAGYLIRAAWPKPELSGTVAGVLLLALTLGLAAYLVRAGRRLDRYLKGARGEEAIAGELARLPSGYRVFHGAGACDHVVLGPSSVFAIETKNWSGRVTVEQGAVWLNGRAPSRPPLEQVQRAAGGLRAALGKACGREIPVQPVLTFASDSLAQEACSVDGVMVCRREALAGLLQAQGGLPLDASTRDSLTECIQGMMV